MQDKERGDSVAKREITAKMVHKDQQEDFDRAFWRQAGHEARFAAAWEMVAEVERIRGKNAGEPRLQRSVAVLKRRGS